jgi:hypothetical protein
MSWCNNKQWCLGKRRDTEIQQSLSLESVHSPGFSADAWVLGTQKVETMLLPDPQMVGAQRKEDGPYPCSAPGHYVGQWWSRAATVSTGLELFVSMCEYSMGTPRYWTGEFSRGWWRHVPVAFESSLLRNPLHNLVAAETWRNSGFVMITYYKQTLYT